MDKICPICYSKFIAKRSDAVCCSKICGTKYWKKNNKEEVKEYKRKHSKTKKSKAGQKIRSARWYNKHQKGKIKTYKKICNNCLKEFVARRSDKIYCSKQCALEFWRNSSKEYIKEYNKMNYGKRKVQKKEWRKNNPEKCLNQKHTRRVKERNTDITAEFLRQLKKETKNCPLCNIELNNIPHHPAQYNLDHIITLNEGGTHTKNNVRFICADCNNRRPRGKKSVL